MTGADRAVEAFGGGFNCAQSVFSAFSEGIGMDRERALRTACAFGAGMGRMCETCGAVTGAFMALGLKYGKVRPEDEPAKEKAYALARELAREFRARNGSIVCKELLGCDLGTPEGMKFAGDHGLHVKKCTKYVRDAAEILEGLL